MILRSIIRGFLGCCPRCNTRGMFIKFLKTRDNCESCSLGFHHHRADDFPPYIVIFLVGHIILGLVLHIEAYWDLSTFSHLLLWVPLSIFLSLILLQPVKGAVIGFQWALGLHGFGKSD